MAFRLGFDIGGTFTDFVLLDEDTGEMVVSKTLTTPWDPSVAVMEGLEGVLAERATSLAQVVQAIHATTLATNTVIERKGEKTALITTRGFRDVLEIQRQKRYDLYNFYVDKPVPLIPRHYIWEVTERINAQGEVLTRLDPGEVSLILQDMKAKGVRSVAICLLHAYRNPEHERLIEQIIHREWPELMVSLSSEVSPLIREYERTNTTVVNAYVMPAVRDYLRKIRAGLGAKGYSGNLYVMQSSGGIANLETVERFPVRIIESGPTAGVLGAVFFGRMAELDNLISFDMGGTTAKICLIEKGQPGTTGEFEIDRVQLKAGSGLTINIPAVDLIEIGAGGGSLARLRMGLIAVGPESAGADPGPICYGKGGTEPTVTDADLVLGYLNPDYFLGGKMKLDLDAAIRGIEEQVAKPLGLSVTEAAWGIHEIVTTHMARATRVVSVERGRDPRLFTLVAFGGAGPVHAARLAKTIGISKVICPAGAGVASAIGLLVADVRFDFARTFIARLDEGVIAPMRELYQEMETLGISMLKESGAKGNLVITRWADMRYVGQGHEVTTPLPPLSFTSKDLPNLRQAFYTAYAAQYGYSDTTEAIEVVNWKLTLSCVTPKPVFQKEALTNALAREALKGQRKVYFPELGAHTDCDIYDRYRLPRGAVIPGPAIIEERESAIVLTPGDSAYADTFGNLILEVKPKEG
jgi:N-methylhydantoinase A